MKFGFSKRVVGGGGLGEGGRSWAPCGEVSAPFAAGALPGSIAARRLKFRIAK